MPKKPTVFYGCATVAEYLKVSRMTLSRWEKILPIPWTNSLGVKYDSCISVTTLDKWVNELLGKHSTIKARRGRDLHKAYKARVFPCL
ncbi:hypothetical protein ES707_22374 [subsurface metagenome]